MKRTPSITFSVWYKGYYREYSEHLNELIKAKTKSDALKKFFRRHHVHKINSRALNETRWWEDDWYMNFRGIQEAELHTCSHCNGTGKVLT
jgi:hypothetical protein